MISLGAVLLYSSYCVSLAGGFLIEDNTPLSLRLADVETSISPVTLLFLNKETNVIVEGITWSSGEEVGPEKNDNYLKYTTYLNDKVVDNGLIDLPDDTLKLPSLIEAGRIAAVDSGTINVRVVLNDGTKDIVVGMNARAYQPWVIAIPIGIAFVMFLLLNIDVVPSLFCSVVVGSCIAEGSFIRGMKSIFDTFLLHAISDTAHVSM
jgi:hypothetical protein